MSKLARSNTDDMEQVFKEKGLENTGIDKGKIVPLDGITEADQLKTLGLSANIKTITVAYTASLTDLTILVNATSAAITVSLPLAASVKGKMYVIKKVDASANVVTIDGAGSELIDGATTKTTSTQYAHYTIQSDGTAWQIIG